MRCSRCENVITGLPCPFCVYATKRGTPSCSHCGRWINSVEPVAICDRCSSYDSPNEARARWSHEDSCWGHPVYFQTRAVLTAVAIGVLTYTFLRLMGWW